MQALRVTFGIVSILLVLVGLIGGLREMGEMYSNLGDQLEYALGSTLGMMIYAAGLWVLYLIIAGIRLIVLRQRQHREQSPQPQ